MASRMWGTTLDTIIEMEVVLADGTITTVSKTNNKDLFWVSLQSFLAFGVVFHLRQVNMCFTICRLSVVPARHLVSSPNSGFKHSRHQQTVSGSHIHSVNRHATMFLIGSQFSRLYKPILKLPLLRNFH